MSLAPANHPDSSEVEVPMPTEQKASRWYDKLVGLLFAILCFEIGVFLLAFPWSRYWTVNYFAWLTPEWREIWMDPYFRGAVSGVGLVNLYVSLLEVFRLQGLAPNDSRE
jgi:hypothetical protein